jgi:hypothetical protein
VIEVNLNADGVVGPALAAMRDSLHIIALSLEALTNSDLRIVPNIPSSFTKFTFAAPANEDLAERRATLTRWLISKGIQELARGIRQSLEEAYLYVSLCQMPDGPTTVEQFNAMVSTLRRKAGRAKFPELMQSVSAKLVEPLTFEQEFRSLQKVRNCLEHRGGVVGPEDTDGAQILRLVLPALKVFVVSENGEIELLHAHRRALRCRDRSSDTRELAPPYPCGHCDTRPSA